MYPNRYSFLWVALIVGFLGLAQKINACEWCDSRQVARLEIIIDANGEILVGREKLVSSSSTDIETLYDRIISAKRVAASENNKLAIWITLEETSLYERYILVLDTFAKAGMVRPCLYIGIYSEDEGYPLDEGENESLSPCKYDNWVYNAAEKKFPFAKHFINNNKPFIPKRMKLPR